MKSKTRVVIFGAGGKVGSLLVEYALAEGYAVTAFIHRHHNLPSHPNLKITKGDAYNKIDVQNVLQDADIVLSALSSWGTPKKDVLSAAMTNIIPTMNTCGIKRIISLTGAEARAAGDTLSVIHRFAHFGIGIVGGKVLPTTAKCTLSYLSKVVSIGQLFAHQSCVPARHKNTHSTQNVRYHGNLSTVKPSPVR